VAKGGKLRDCAYTILFEKVTGLHWIWRYMTSVDKKK